MRFLSTTTTALLAIATLFGSETCGQPPRESELVTAAREYWSGFDEATGRTSFGSSKWPRWRRWKVEHYSDDLHKPMPTPRYVFVVRPPRPRPMRLVIQPRDLKPFEGPPLTYYPPRWSAPMREESDRD